MIKISVLCVNLPLEIEYQTFLTNFHAFQCIVVRVTHIIDNILQYSVSNDLNHRDIDKTHLQIVF